MIRTYTIDVEPVSVNEAYVEQVFAKGRFGRVRRHLADWAERQQLEINILMRAFDDEQYGGRLEADEYDILYMLYWPRETIRLKYERKLRAKRRDVTNYFKITEDGIFKYLGEDRDDSFVVNTSAHKRVSDTSFPHYQIFMAPGGEIYPPEFFSRLPGLHPQTIHPGEPGWLT